MKNSKRVWGRPVFLALSAAFSLTAGGSLVARSVSAAPVTMVSSIPALAPGRISPNKLNAAQAQATILADHDIFWQRAETAFPVSEATPAIPVTRWNLFGHGDRTRKEIALTFDDGPHPGCTQQLLEVLKKYRVPATFFVVGEMAERAPDLVRQEIADGNEVGNHTYHHVSLVKITPDEAAAEIRACDLVLQSITGQPVHLFRPPGGKYDPDVAREAAAQGYTTVLWTDDPGDYTSPGVGIVEDRTIRTAHNGGILLLHDGIQQTVDALPTIIDTLRAEGFTFVTVDQMLAHRGEVAPLHALTHTAVAVAARK